MSKKKSAQKKLVNELKNQLLVQAERLEIREYYSPVTMEELKIDSVRKILTEFYMERANLQYEMNSYGTNKKEVLIKLERLNAYIRKAEGLRERGLKNFEKLLDKGLGDKEKALKAIRKLKPVSVRVAV